jgi:hypothetical protein
MKKAEREKLLGNWQRALKRAKGWAND